MAKKKLLQTILFILMAAVPLTLEGQEVVQR